MDTDVFVAAVRSPTGASAAWLRRVLGGWATLVASTPLFVEYEAVATRPEHLTAAGASTEDVCNLLDALAGCVEVAEPHFRWRPQLRDSNDEMVLEAAVNGRAQAILTFNRRHFESVATRFGVAVLSPGEALSRFKAEE